MIQRIVVILSWCILIACQNKNAERLSGSHDLTGVKIGDQVWSATNLNVSTFRNGDTIPEITLKEAWEKAGKEGKPGWCYYENDANNGKTYGRMYNWHAINDPRGLAPAGWHIATNEEWITLETYLGIPVAGRKLKCNMGWNANGHGDNSSELCVLPGGYRSREGRFSGVGEFIYISSSTDDKPSQGGNEKTIVWGRGIQFESNGVMRCELYKEFGMYVRCIKDN